MKSFKTYWKEWEKNAKKDPYWAILTSSKYEENQWDQRLFFESGEREIFLLQEYLKASGLVLPFQGEALDFGCGVGRLTRALAQEFSKVQGIDIASHMIQEAQKVEPVLGNVTYIHNPFNNLEIFKADRFDFIYSNVVLQHVPPRYQRHYLAEFARITKHCGWVVVQIPSEKNCDSFFKRIKRKTLSFIPKTIKNYLKTSVLKRKLKYSDFFNIEMNPQAEEVICCFAHEHGLEIKHIAYTNSCDPDFCGELKFKTLEEARKESSYVSPMYFFQKRSA